jgi:hypothetical protein
MKKNMLKNSPKNIYKVKNFPGLYLGPDLTGEEVGRGWKGRGMEEEGRREGR